MNRTQFCFRIATFVGFALAAVGCSDRTEAPFGESGSAEVSLRLGVDSVGREITVGTTKGSAAKAPASLDPHEDLAIYVINTRNDTLARWKNFNSLPSSRLKFTPGAYKFVAEYQPEGGVRLPSFDSYIYRAEEKFVLAARDTYECDLVAKLACGKITVDFDESFSYYYPNYSVDIRTAGDEFLNFKKGTTNWSGYFAPGTVRLRFHLITQDFDLLTFSPEPLPAIKAGEHYRLTIEVGADHGNTQVIVLHTETETNPMQTVEIEVPRYFLPKDPPSYTAVGFTDGVAQSLFEGEQAEWSIQTKVPGGIASFVLHIGDQDNALRERLGVGAEVTTIDFAGLPAGDPMRQRLQEAGFRWGEALNSPEDAEVSSLAWVDFTEAMRARADHSAAEYDFGFTLVDNYGQTLDPNGNPVSVRARIEYPEMKLVPPKPADIWSSTAYFTVQANYDLFNGQHPTLQYRRKSGGAAWNDAVEGDNLTVSALPMTENGTIYNVRYELQGLNPGSETGREYEFRVVVNADRTSPVYTLTSEPRQAVPNGSFSNYTESALYGVRYVFEDGWATRNPATAGQEEQRLAANDVSCKSSTYPEQIDGETWVAMKTCYWGRAEYWSFGNKQTTPKNITAGLLYLGSYAYTYKKEGIGTSPQPYYEILNTETLDRGIAWPSRPTSLSLDYIFLPKDDDDNRDRGYICVAVYGTENGTEVEIAKGEVYLDPYSGKREAATALKIQLDYSRTDLKATKLDVFFSSSEHYSKDQTPACNGGTYTGNILKVKSVRLNYEK